jgi:hypothetical protein
MTTASVGAPSSPPNSTSWMRAPRFSIFSAEIGLPHVLVGVAEMLLQLQHALVEALQVVHEMADLGMNRSAASRMRASFWICWTTWMASISSDSDT